MHDVTQEGSAKHTHHDTYPGKLSSQKETIRVESSRVVSCRVVSCRVVPCRVVSCRVVSCRVVSCRVVCHHLLVLVASCCPVVLSCSFFSCRVVVRFRVRAWVRAFVCCLCACE